MAELEILPEGDATVCTNTEDLFTLETLEPPLVKVRYLRTGAVRGYQLDGLARWLALKRIDPVDRSARYSEDQVLEIRGRFGYFKFCEALGPKEFSDEIHATKGDLAAMAVVFRRMSQDQLSRCLFLAHRGYFAIFREVYETGWKKGWFDITTLELFLAISTTDFDEIETSLEYGFFTVQLVRLFKEQLYLLPPKARGSAKVQQAIGHFVVCACTPALRLFLLHFLVYYGYLVPRRFMKIVRSNAKGDTHIRSILIKAHLVAEGMLSMELAELSV